MTLQMLFSAMHDEIEKMDDVSRAVHNHAIWCVRTDFTAAEALLGHHFGADEAHMLDTIIRTLVATKVTKLTPPALHLAA